MSKSNRPRAKKTTGMKGPRNACRGAEAKSRREALAARDHAKLGGSGRGVGKLSSIIAMLRRPKGATIEQMMTATGWQPHSVRGAISGALKKKRGLTVTSATESGGTRVYRIVG